VEAMQHGAAAEAGRSKSGILRNLRL